MQANAPKLRIRPGRGKNLKQGHKPPTNLKGLWRHKIQSYHHLKPKIVIALMPLSQEKKKPAIATEAELIKDILKADLYLKEEDQ